MNCSGDLDDVALSPTIRRYELSISAGSRRSVINTRQAPQAGGSAASGEPVDEKSAARRARRSKPGVRDRRADLWFAESGRRASPFLRRMFLRLLIGLR